MIEGVLFSAQKTNNGSAQSADGMQVLKKFESQKEDFLSFLQAKTQTTPQKWSGQIENQQLNQTKSISKTIDKNQIEVSAEQQTSNEASEAAAASALITLNMDPAQNTSGSVEIRSNASPVTNTNGNIQANAENGQIINNNSTLVDAQTTAQAQNSNTGVVVSEANASTNADMSETDSKTSKPTQAQSTAQQATEILKNSVVKQEGITPSSTTAKTPNEVQPQPQPQNQLSQQTQTLTQLPTVSQVANQTTAQTQLLSASNGQGITAAAIALTTQPNKTSNASSTAAKIENVNSSSATASNTSAPEVTSESNKASSNTSAQTPAATQTPTTATNTSSAPTLVQPANVQELLSALPDTELLEGLEPSSEETNLSSTTSNSATGKAQELPPTLRHASSVSQQAWAGLIQRMDGKSHQFQIRLDPAALGQINVSIEITKDKRATVVLAAKSAEALSELSRGSKALEAALADAGVELAEDGLKLELSSDENSSFTFKDDDAEQMADDKGEASSSNSSVVEENADLPRQITPKLTAWSRARVDLRA